MQFKKPTKYTEESIEATNAITEYVNSIKHKKRTLKCYTQHQVDEIRKQYENELRDKNALIVEMSKDPKCPNCEEHSLVSAGWFCSKCGYDS